MATIGATTLGEILPSSMGPTTLDAVADIVAPKKSTKMSKKYAAHEAKESKAFERWEHTTKAGRAHEARERAAMMKKSKKPAAKPAAKKPAAPAKTNTGRKNADGLTIWKGPRGGLFVMKNGKKSPVAKKSASKK